MSANSPAVEVIAEVLAPLRERYAHWLALDAADVLADRDEAAEDVRALQLVLRMERSGPPDWRTAVGLAATTVARVCTDPRTTDPDGPWRAAVEDYCRGHIRKVTRRARATQWAAVQDLPGITLAGGGTEVRALLPGRTADLDKRVARLQVGGTDAPYDSTTPADQPARGDTAGPVLQMWLPPTPVMTLGKSMAQAGHAAMIAAALLAGDPATMPELASWLAAGCPARGDRADPGHWAALTAAVADPPTGWRADRLLAVRDAGFTEIDPGTITVIARIR